jgi:hypothetical protein
MLIVVLLSIVAPLKDFTIILLPFHVRASDHVLTLLFNFIQLGVPGVLVVLVVLVVLLVLVVLGVIGC